MQEKSLWCGSRQIIKVIILSSIVVLKMFFTHFDVSNIVIHLLQPITIKVKIFKSDKDVIQQFLKQQIAIFINEELATVQC